MARLKQGEKHMTMNFVPRDVFIRHESEWQAVREAVDGRIDIGRREKPLASAASDATSAGENSPSAEQSE